MICFFIFMSLKNLHISLDEALIRKSLKIIILEPVIMTQVSLYHLGATLLSPSLSFISEQVSQAVPKQKKVFFLAREGYWLQQAYQTYCRAKEEEDNSQYLLVSRAFLFKVGLSNPLSYPIALKGEFKGTLYDLMRSRFMLSHLSINDVFSEEEQKQTVELPTDISMVSLYLESRLEGLTKVTEETRSTYTQYLSSIGFFEQETIHMVDLGYSGTIQKLITMLFNKDTVGHYLIASNPGVSTYDDCSMEMIGYLKEGVKLTEGYIPLDRSMFWESLLTAPVGQFQDIRPSALPNCDFDYYYGRKVATQHNFHLLEQVCKGALDTLKYHAENDVSFTKEEVEQLYTSFVMKNGMLPKSSWPLFSIDDDVSSYGTVEPLAFFGLK